MLSEGDSDSSLPSPIRTQYCSSDMEASGEESEPRPPPGKTAVWVLKRQGQKVIVEVTQNFSSETKLQLCVYSVCPAGGAAPEPREAALVWF